MKYKKSRILLAKTDHFSNTAIKKPTRFHGLPFQKNTFEQPHITYQLTALLAIIQLLILIDGTKHDWKKTSGPAIAVHADNTPFYSTTSIKLKLKVLNKSFFFTNGSVRQDTAS